MSACSVCDDTGLVEAPVWRWQADRWLPCPEGCAMPEMKARTLYECLNPDCGKSSRWTGDLSWRTRGDHLCMVCQVPLTELVDDGTRWKVEWEMQSPWGDEWHQSARETTSRKDALDQYTQLAEWERTGDEPVRSVKVYRSTVVWDEVDVDAFLGTTGDPQP